MSDAQGPFAKPAPAVGQVEAARTRLNVDLNAVRVEPLNDLHERHDFCCQDRAIQNFCRQGIDRQNRQDIIRAFVARIEPEPAVVGFYYLTTTSWEHEDVGRSVGDRFLMLDKIPAVYLGMLGVHSSADRQGIGTVLMLDAFRRVLAIAENAGVWALTLDAVDEDAARYYERFDFERITPGGLEMFLALGTIKALFET